MSNGKGTLTSGSDGQKAEVYLVVLPDGYTGNKNAEISTVGFSSYEEGTSVRVEHVSGQTPDLAIVAGIPSGTGVVQSNGVQLTVTDRGSTPFSENDLVDIASTWHGFDAGTTVEFSPVEKQGGGNEAGYLLAV